MPIMTVANDKLLFFLHFKENMTAGLIDFLFDLIIYVKSTIFQLCPDRSSWIEPVLSKDK